LKQDFTVSIPRIAVLSLNPHCGDKGLLGTEEKDVIEPAIEAMREIRKKNESLVFIVMSAYDKFDYAQEAMKLGAIEYLTKPMEKNKMIAAIRHAMDIVSQEKERRSQDLLVREKLETVVPILENGLIYNILFQEYFEEDIENYKTILEISASSAYMMVIVCGDEREGNHMTNAVGSSVKLQKNYTRIREYLKLYFNCFVGNVMGNKIAVMVPSDETEPNLGARNEAIEKARALAHKLSDLTGNSYRIGIGKTKELSEMEQSYKEAIDALLLTTNTVAHADDLPIGAEFESDYPIEQETRLFDEVEKGRTDAAVSAAKDFFFMVRNWDMMDARTKVLEFAMRAETLAYSSGGRVYNVGSRRNYLPTVMGIDNMDELWEWFKEKIIFSSNAISNKRADSSNDIIANAKKFIEENYTKNITLEDVSQQVNISAYYFSRIFKEATNENFIDYLTGLRIERAKELLSSTQYSMKEICNMSGYSDPNYFSKTFKKKVGVTPTEYREGK